MEIIGTRNDWREIWEYCESIKELGQPEKSRCARGRRNLWLKAEPNYSTGKYRRAIEDDYLWGICREIYPDGDLAQIYYGNRGIDWHRDASYCTRIGRILNLGNAILETKDGEKLISLKLTGGEIIEFNTKLLHRGIPDDQRRIGIGIWRAKIPIHTNWEN